MAIDPRTDDLIPVAVVAEGVLGHRVSPATLWRWTTHGVRGVRLNAVRVGRRTYTTLEAFADFVRAQTESAYPPTDESNDRTPAKQKRLEAAGLI